MATAPDWQRALDRGSYTTSTLGRPLAEEGFIHASRSDQWEGVLARFYADVAEPLVLLEVETDRLTSPWRTEQLHGADQPYPHVYGPLDLDAVVSVHAQS